MNKWFANTSIQTKINLALLVVLVLIMFVSMLFTIRSERNMVEATMLQNVRDTTDSYLDTLNIMMLTGTLDQFREVHRDKVLSQPGITEAKVLRAQPVIDLYGSGQAKDQPTDELDRRALQGEAIEIIRSTPNGRLLTVLRPVISETNYRGTDCTTCHINSEGQQLGVIRLSYSLASLDRRINLNLLQLAGIQALLFIFGLGIISYALYRLVLRPLSKLRKAIQKAETESDLTVRVKAVNSDDEIGLVAKAFNSMLERFSASLAKVAKTTSSIKIAANTISSMSNKTLVAVNNQQSETERVASAIEEMQASANETREFAHTTADESNAADKEAQLGAEVAQHSISSIHKLTQNLTKAAQVTHNLNTFSDDVGKMLELITAIAEQTNLLALNAAIEAARAGESGRGFAVVADEVRSLANRTHEATQEVQQTIENLQAEAREAVSIMSFAGQEASKNVTDAEQVAQSLTHIAAKVASISDLNYKMSSAAQEQYEVAGRVNSQISSISTLALQTSSNAAKSSGISNDLVNLAQELDQLVASFKLNR